MNIQLVTLEDIRAAAARVVEHRAGDAAARRVGGRRTRRCTSSVKTCSRAGAFKIRGAYNMVAQLTDDQRGAG